MPIRDSSISPAALALHYGQTVFEGMKAMRMFDGRLNIFRINKHAERFNRSLERMCMPPVPVELFRDQLIELVKKDRRWIPASPGALYLRPFMFASEEKFGLKISDEYKFIIFTGPVGPYYSQPLKVK